MSDAGQRVVLFHSTSHAIKAERTLKKAAIDCKMIPVPRQLSSDCGICIQFSACDSMRVLEELQKRKIEFDGPVTIGE
jgi:TPP-dependent indolepyruvate ferredoxin oxidoreductase alpha subunit